MPYALLTGEFVIRYPDLPRSGPQPDGDTVKFAPDSPPLVQTLPRPSGGGPDINERGISVRLEAIDALETHFEGAHQELAAANAARDELLRALGFTGVTFFPDLPNTVASADQDRVRGHVLSNGIDANGRMIGFVEPGEATEPDGTQVFLDVTRARGSVNAALLAAGLAYPALYSTLPASLRVEFAQAAREARAAGAGLWPRATADPEGAAQIADLAALEGLVLWPKLFRRLVPYLAEGASGFDGFDAWLRADPVNRDDQIVLVGRTEPARLHDVVEAAGDHVQLTAWPEDFVITPDPPQAER
jgi:endonuclease YncB( thermonuclease family)